MRGGRLSKDQSGTTIAEFAVVAGVFFLLIIGIIEFGRLFYTHNALTDAARRGARYAVLHPKNAPCVKNVVVYGETHIDPVTCVPSLGASPLINGLTPSNVTVVYDPSDYKLNNGTATVSITAYTFNLGIPLVGRNVNMPAYASTLTAESAGTKPTDIIVP
jgi:Flp pilus assembly pilin Flp